MMRSLIVTVLSLLVYTSAARADETNPKKTICLNMIIKNESHVIRRCLASVKPIIDYWVIVDTGSTDGTQEIVREFMKDIPGELHERPWKNFAHNRNEALEFAKDKADYLLFIDADETLIFTPDFVLPTLDRDVYYFEVNHSGSRYSRVHLVGTHINWKWKGVLHEAIMSPQARTSDTLKGVSNFVRCDGASWRDPQKYLKHAEILEAGLLEEPNNSRYVFYLAQSYRDAGVYDKSIQNYERRITMGGWNEEVFWSMFQVGRMKERQGAPLEDVIESYCRAYLYRPTRVEPLHYMARFYRENGEHLAAYLAAKQGLMIAVPPDILFVETWLHDYGMLFEFSICAYWAEKYAEAHMASHLLLANKKLPQNIREAVERNLTFINEKISDMKQLQPQMAAIQE